MTYLLDTSFCYVSATKIVHYKSITELFCVSEHYIAISLMNESAAFNKSVEYMVP